MTSTPPPPPPPKQPSNESPLTTGTKAAGAIHRRAEELSARSPSSPLICPADLDAFPACMDDAVAAAFHRHFGTFNRLQRSSALLLLHTLLSAREPLTPGQLQLALGEDMAQLGFGPGGGSAPGRPVRDYLAAMLPGWGTLVVEREGRVVFAQASLREWLTDRDRAAAFFIDLSQGLGHRKLATAAIEVGGVSLVLRRAVESAAAASSGRRPSPRRGRRPPPGSPGAYALRYVAAHLALGGLREVVEALLLDGPRLVQRLFAAGMGPRVVAEVSSLAAVLPNSGELDEATRWLKYISPLLLRWPANAHQLMHDAPAPSHVHKRTSLGAGRPPGWLLTRPSSWPADVLTLGGHSGEVSCVAFSPAGSMLASCSYDGSDPGVRLWDLRSGRQAATLHGHASAVLCVAFSPDGVRVASSSADGVLCVFDVVAGGDPVLVIQTGDAPVLSVAYSPDGRLLATGCYNKTLHLWDAITGLPLASMDWHGGAVNCVAFSPDSTLLASASGDKSVRLYDASSFRQIACLEGHAGYVNCVSWSPDGAILASASDDCSIRLWNVASRTQAALMEDSSSYVCSVVFSPCGGMLASGGGDKVVRVYARNGSLLASLPGHSDYVRSIRFSTDGALLASGSDDRSIRLWDVRAALKAHTDPKVALAGTASPLHPCSGHLSGRLTSRHRVQGDNATRLYSLTKGGKRAATIADLSGPATAVAFNADGSLIVAGTESGDLRLLDMRSGEQIACFEGHSLGVTAVSFCPTGCSALGPTSMHPGVGSGSDRSNSDSASHSTATCLVASSSRDGTVLLWTRGPKASRGGVLVARLECGSGAVLGLAFSPNGARLAVVTEAGAMQVWSVSDCRLNSSTLDVPPAAVGHLMCGSRDSTATGEPSPHPPPSTSTHHHPNILLSGNSTTPNATPPPPPIPPPTHPTTPTSPLRHPTRTA
ncbi:MAG: hypothetical protein WDW36_003507 [Sanguina aurantia]